MLSEESAGMSFDSYNKYRIHGGNHARGNPEALSPEHFSPINLITPKNPKPHSKLSKFNK